MQKPEFQNKEQALPRKEAESVSSSYQGFPGSTWDREQARPHKLYIHLGLCPTSLEQVHHEG